MDVYIHAYVPSGKVLNLNLTICHSNSTTHIDYTPWLITDVYYYNYVWYKLIKYVMHLSQGYVTARCTYIDTVVKYKRFEDVLYLCISLIVSMYPTCACYCELHYIFLFLDSDPNNKDNTSSEERYYFITYTPGIHR